jgi:hypothetical protein
MVCPALEAAAPCGRGWQFSVMPVVRHHPNTRGPASRSTVVMSGGANRWQRLHMHVLLAGWLLHKMEKLQPLA